MGFEPAIPLLKRLGTSSLDRTAADYVPRLAFIIFRKTDSALRRAEVWWGGVELQPHELLTLAINDKWSVSCPGQFPPGIFF